MGCPEILLSGFRSAQIARVKSELRALTNLPRPQKVSAKTLLSGYSFTELCIRVCQDFCTSIYIGYSGFVVGKADRSKNDGPSSHSFSRNCPRAVLAVKAPLRRAKRGLDCSGPL
jgi:hypothetical protein